MYRIPLICSLIAALVAQPLANDDVLEPSIEIEVLAALDRAAKVKCEHSAANRAFAASYVTNNLSATEIAVRLVSTQKADGRWYSGTNDVTFAARAILARLVGLAASTNTPSSKK